MCFFKGFKYIYKNGIIFIFREEVYKLKVTHVLKVKTNFFWDSLNVIRASILGANDGIISVSGIVLGAAGANLDSKTLLISGLSGMLAGACSMAGGEWISVSTQRDIQEKTMERQLENEDCENCPIKLQKNDILMPFHAAASSFCSFIIGAMIPLLTMILARPEHRVVFTLIAMIASLSINAIVCTHNSEVSTSKTILRNVITGLLTTLVTFILGASV